MDSATAVAAAARAAAALSPRKRMKTGVPTILSVGPWASKQVDPLAKTMPVTSPTTGEVVSNVQLGSAADVDRAVAAAKEAHPAWAALTSKRRAAIMLKFHGLCTEHEDELVELIMKENGKNRTEALGDLAKGLETVEWACSIPQHAGAGRTLSVSGGIVCQEIRDPVGVVACVVPFNFPFMVPMWTTPIALVCGDAVVLKPSEKVPMTMNRVANLLYEAGVPPAVFQLVQGAKEVVDALCDHPDIAALTFVGSSKVAKLVYERAKLTGKKALALGACPKTLTCGLLCPKPVPKACPRRLATSSKDHLTTTAVCTTLAGGAKNHLVSAPDCDLEMASSDIVASFAGCAGQRCMAASVLLTIGAQPALIDKVVDKASKLAMGTGKGCMGPVIDEIAEARIRGFIDMAERDGAKVLLDGRTWADKKMEGHGQYASGHWVGPTVLEMPPGLRRHPAMHEEIFGPVLCVHPVTDASEALAIEQADPHGNAACIYTSSGATADWFSRRFSAAMIGVNIGVPVPREPFSFGGLEGSKSKYGEHDITGEGGLNFFSSLRKVTTKWASNPNAAPDAANFGGVM